MKHTNEKVNWLGLETEHQWDRKWWTEHCNILFINLLFSPKIYWRIFRICLHVVCTIICGCFAHFVMNITVQWSMSRKTAFITSKQHLIFKLNILSRSEYITHPNRRYWHSDSISISHDIDIQPNIISRLPMRTSERSIVDSIPFKI